MKRVVIMTPGLYGLPFQGIVDLPNDEADNLIRGRNAAPVVPRPWLGETGKVTAKKRGPKPVEVAVVEPAAEPVAVEPVEPEEPVVEVDD